MLKASAQSRHNQHYENHNYIFCVTFEPAVLAHPFSPDRPSLFGEAQRSDSLKEFATLTGLPHSSDNPNKYIILSSEMLVRSLFHPLQE